jgi:hypothetical protein
MFHELLQKAVVIHDRLGLASPGFHSKETFFSLNVQTKKNQFNVHNPHRKKSRVLPRNLWGWGKLFQDDAT